MSYLCKSYCSHGGKCKLQSGHDGDHDSGYCAWTDAEALTREQADAVLRGMPGGAEFLRDEQPMADFFESFGGDEDVT